MLNVGACVSLPSTAVVLVAGGVSFRMQSSIEKPFMPLGNRRVIDHSLHVFSELSFVNEICIVCDEKYYDTFSDEYTFALPGKRRQDSVFNGLKVLKKKPTLVAIHDAARPLITTELVERVVLKASLTQGAIAAVPVKSTIKYATQESVIKETLDRSLLWEAQTPQVFSYNLLLDAYEHPINHDFHAVDDASLVERLGHPVSMVMGCYKNIKLTTPEDLLIASKFMN